MQFRLLSRKLELRELEGRYGLEVEYMTLVAGLDLRGLRCPPQLRDNYASVWQVCPIELADGFKRRGTRRARPCDAK